jgi:hypothetical protein
MTTIPTGRSTKIIDLSLEIPNLSLQFPDVSLPRFLCGYYLLLEALYDGRLVVRWFRSNGVRGFDVFVTKKGARG